MNPASKRLVVKPYFPGWTFSDTDVKAACGNNTNILITMAKPYSPCYSTLYMWDYLCAKPGSISKKGLGYVENCNINTTHYISSQPIIGGSGCFFPFYNYCQNIPYPPFATVASVLSLLCLIGFLFNVGLVVMSCMKRLASCRMRRIIVGICVYEALASLIQFLDPFLYWDINGHSDDSIMTAYIQKYVIDPNFVRAFCSCFVLAVATYLQIIRPNAFDFFINSRHFTINSRQFKMYSCFFILPFFAVFPLFIYFLYYELCYPITDAIKSSVASGDPVIKEAVGYLTDKRVFSGLILAISILITFILTLRMQCALDWHKAQPRGTNVIEKTKNDRSIVRCLFMLMLAELVVLMPMYANAYTFVKEQYDTFYGDGAEPRSTSLNNFIQIGFLFEATLPIIIALIIGIGFRPYRLAFLGVRVSTRLTKVNRANGSRSANKSTTAADA